jgi:hypothetical protein
MAEDITTNSLSLVWVATRHTLTNGPIRHYGICYQEASLGTNCTRIESIPGQQTSYEITKGLRPHTKYVLTVETATAAVGWGPKAVIYDTTLTTGRMLEAIRIQPRLQKFPFATVDPLFCMKCTVCKGTIDIFCRLCKWPWFEVASYEPYISFHYEM